MSIFKKKINEFPAPYTCKNAVKKGGLETKLSMALMGFGNIVHGQIIKGLLYLAIEIAYIVFMAVNGIGFIGGLRTLGTVKQQEVWDEAKQIYLYTKGDQSVLILLYGVTTILLTILTIPLNMVKLKKCLAKWQNTLYQTGWNSLFMNNHDLPRIVSRWGNDGKYRKESAKMLATMLHGMQGTPYIYQGEELGMTNVQFDSIEEYEDIETLNMYKERLEKGYQPEEIMHSIYARSRDNARTPMQWSGEENGGFTTGEPWFTVNPNYIRINAKEALEDENSVFYYYQKLIRLRKENPVFVNGKFELLLPEDERIFAYTRTDEHTKMLVCTNFTDEEVSCPLLDEWKAGEVWIRNYEDGREGNILRPYEAVIIGAAGNVVKAG